MGRRLGQHFLTDPHILDRIADAVEPEPQDAVSEIGPRRGTLTRRLAPRVGRVIAIEKDRRLAAALEGKGKGEKGKVVAENVEIIVADALGADWQGLVTQSTFALSPFPLPTFTGIGNLPYSIPTPLIEKALSLPSCRMVVFLVQREVAERLAAAPGSKAYGALTAGVQAVAAVEHLFPVRPGAFRPAPNVDSAVVRLRPLVTPLVADAEREAWRRFLAGLFSQRRKLLGRSLWALSGRSRDAIKELLAALGIDPTERPETVAPAQLVRLFRDVRARE